MAALRILEDEARVQDEAVKAAQENPDPPARRMAAAVLLVQALGGGWNATDLPSSEDVRRDRPVKRNP